MLPATGDSCSFGSNSTDSNEVQQRATQEQQVERAEADGSDEDGEPDLCSIDDLPPPVLATMLGYIDSLTHLLTAAAVSKKWHDVVMNGRWPAVQELRLNTVFQGVSAAGLRWAAHHCPGLSTVDLSGCSCLSDDSVGPLGALSLTSLSLARLWRFESITVLQGLLSPLLTHLDLSDTLLALSPGLVSTLAASGCGMALRSIRLDGCHCTNKGQAAVWLRGLLEGSSPELEALSLSRCSWLSGERLTEALRNASSLRRLSAADCRAFSDAAEDLPAACPMLQYLDLSRSGASDATLTALSQHCHGLEELRLAGCIQIRGPGLLDLAESPAVTSGTLRTLHLTDLPGLKSSTAQPLLLAFRQGLEKTAATQAPVDAAKEEWTADHCEAPGSLTLTNCCHVDDTALLALCSSPSSSLPPGLLTRFELGGCSGVSSPESLGRLASSATLDRLTVLDLSHLEALRLPSPEADNSLGLIASSAGPHLVSLRLDGCAVTDSSAEVLAQCCTRLKELALVGCKGLGDIGIEQFALQTSRCCLRQLVHLEVGGNNMKWTEERGLAAFSGLRGLKIMRRSQLSDKQLGDIVGRNPDLRALTLAGCNEVTDDGLARLPAASLTSLELVACRRVEGAALARLRALRRLRLPGCPDIQEAALQASVAVCSRLVRIELPSHLHIDCLPSQAEGGHLYGLRVDGGSQELRRRSRQRPANAHR